MAIFFGMIGYNSILSKSDWLHVVWTFGVFFINLRYILYIPLEHLISFVRSCSTGLFLKLIGSYLNLKYQIILKSRTSTRLFLKLTGSSL